jgi:hypothetical protein
MANVPVVISRTIIERPNGLVSSPPATDFTPNPLNPDGISQIPPVHLAYTSEANMIAGQANQIANFIYFDGTKYWEYLGTTNGTIVDYRAWSGGDIVQPNGLTQIGTFVQTGNDIDVNPDWIWRFNQVLYQKTTITPFTISPAAVGFTRIDLIYGNTSTQVLLISGTEVEDPTPAVPPSVPANSVGFFLVFVDDSGITAFQEFALSSFVRFDINNQNLSFVQRQNARTNIQALSKDTNDSRVGQLFQNGELRVSLNSPAYSLTGSRAVRILGQSAVSASPIIIQIISGDASAPVSLLSMQNRGNIIFNNYESGSVNWNFRFQKNGNNLISSGSEGAGHEAGGSTIKVYTQISCDNRSNVPTALTRRDELPFNYPQTVATTGIIDDLSLANEGVKLLILTLADELTGVVPVTTNTGRELKIESRVAGGTIIRHDSASSTAANRFSLPSATDLTINQNEIYTFIYTNGRWRRVL